MRQVKDLYTMGLPGLCTNIVPPISGTGIAVPQIAGTKKRGRPVTGCAMSGAERNRRYRAKRALMLAAARARAAGVQFVLELQC